MPRNFRPKFRPVLRPALCPEFRPVKKICRRDFALGNVRRNLSVKRISSLIRDGPTTTTTIFEFISRGPIFDFLGYPPRMTHQMPSLHSGTQRNHKDFSCDVPSNAVLVWHQMQNFFWKIMVVVVFGLSLS